MPLESGSDSRIIRNSVETYDPVRSAINHPIGHITQALINLCFKQNPNDNDLLPAGLKPIFTALCDLQVDRYRHGRVLLGSRLITFFRVDRHWTEQHLLPLFGWSNPVEAKAVWLGQCINEIRQAAPQLVTTDALYQIRYQNLQEYLRRQGI